MRYLLTSALLHISVLMLLIFACHVNGANGGSGGDSDKGGKTGFKDSRKDMEIILKDVPTPIAQKAKDKQGQIKQKASKCKDSFGGIGVGIGLNQKTGIAVITTVYPGYPAEAAGIEPGDILISPTPDGIEGKPGTVVTLMLRRDDSILQKIITRDVICLERKNEE